jgi:ubiquinone/menaquinone biosynthesis C-methylase UbiE
MFTPSDVIYRHPFSVIDPASAGETARLWLQHTAIHTCLDLLPKFASDVVQQNWRLLDLACGPGDWLCDAAFEFPSAVVIGIDPCPNNVEYAHARARTGLRHNVSCEVMDLKEQLHLPHASFDLISGRFLSAWLDLGEWLPLLQQCRSLLRPGGMLRLVEATTGRCSSPACEQLSAWYEQALVQTGVHPVSGKPRLVWFDLLTQAGYEQITERVEVLDFSVGHVPCSLMRQVILAFFSLVQPFVIKSGVVAEEDFVQMYGLMHWEIMSDDFSGCWRLLDLQARPRLA